MTKRLIILLSAFYKTSTFDIIFNKTKERKKSTFQPNFLTNYISAFSKYAFFLIDIEQFVTINEESNLNFLEARRNDIKRANVQQLKTTAAN